MDIKWLNSALHVGDCAVFISYDVDKPLREQRYIKLANFPDCKSQSEQTQQMQLPEVLPAGRAILRWDWYALHVNPPEWYDQCADIEVISSSNRDFTSFNSFKIVDPPIYPETGFRKAFSADGKLPGQANFYQTGPACIDDSINQCYLTAVGTRGYTGFGGEGGTPGTTIAATTSVATTTAATTMAPTTIVTTATSTTDGATTLTSTMSARCDICAGGNTCIWTDGNCYPVAEGACNSIAGTIWCGATASTTTTTPVTTVTSSSTTTPVTTATTTSVMTRDFIPVDGGSDRACRGTDSSDNDASYYNVHAGTGSLDACKDVCRATQGCAGIEFNAGNGRCEVWTRSEGIEATVAVAGYECLRLERASCRARTTAVGFFGTTDEICSTTCALVPKDSWPCSSDGPCDCSALLAQVHVHRHLRAVKSRGNALMQQDACLSEASFEDEDED